jgi:phosphate transport system ATP-binding protein
MMRKEKASTKYQFAFMLLGEVIEHCHTDDLFSAPQNPKTAEYIQGRFG